MSSYITKKTPADTSWLTYDRFGMFIHFGLYSLPARHEWMKALERTPEEKYQKYFEHFNPDLIDVRQWAKYAKAAGMKYAVLTTKHHEGFCLFDSKYTDYKITNTPFGRDLVKEYVEAFRAEGLRVGFYYSLLDWHHPDYPIDPNHPRRKDADAQAQDKGRDMKKYAEYMRNQVTELLTNYGKIDIIWFDFSFDGICLPQSDNDVNEKIFPWMQFGGTKRREQWESEQLIKTIRSLQPDIIINNRTDIPQDTATPEQYQMLDWCRDKETGELLVWEACQTFSGSWGYYRDEMTWKSPKMMIDMLVNTVSVGGNLLMNVGPTGRGNIDDRAVRALGVFEEWMKYNSRSIYGCTMAEPEFFENTPRGTRLTQSEDGKRLYIHLTEYPYKCLEMQKMAGKVEYAQFLYDASEILFLENDKPDMSNASDNNEGSVSFLLPEVAPNVIVPVIEVYLKDNRE